MFRNRDRILQGLLLYYKVLKTFWSAIQKQNFTWELRLRAHRDRQPMRKAVPTMVFLKWERNTVFENLWQKSHYAFMSSEINLRFCNFVPFLGKVKFNFFGKWDILVIFKSTVKKKLRICCFARRKWGNFVVSYFSSQSKLTPPLRTTVLALCIWSTSTTQ